MGINLDKVLIRILEKLGFFPLSVAITFVLVIIFPNVCPKVNSKIK